MSNFNLNQFLRFVTVSFVAAGLICAQTETGQITGTVTDPSGAIVANANISIKNVASGTERTTVSNGSGIYLVANLEPGEYQVIVTAQGFSTTEARVTVTVGTKSEVNAALKVGQTSNVIEVSESAVQVNAETQTIQQTLSTQQVLQLPTLTRNPYALVATSGNVSEDDPAARGVGVAINGLRSEGTNVLLDGVANNNEFNASVGQMTPLDSVQEVGIITNNFTAEYGRADSGIVNVTTKTGTNAFHGTAYEFLRVSDLASNTFENNATDVAKPHYTRNQFGYSFGGPIKKNKLFFFSDTEWTRVRSIANITTLVPDPALIAAAAPNVQSIFSTYGKLGGITPISVLSRNALTALGQDPCGGATTGGCATYNPGAPMFDLVSYATPSDSGAGVPQNTYNSINRVDYSLSDKTQMFAEYSLYSEYDFAGGVANSPYPAYNTGQTSFNNVVIASITHTFSPTFVSQSKVDFNRFNNLQPLSSAGVVPRFFLGSAGVVTAIAGYDVSLPGYLPGDPSAGIPFGGPQNFGQAYQDFSWTKGSHAIRFGGSATYLRDNRTFGAYQQGMEVFGNTVPQGIDNLLAGDLYSFQAAIYPQGKYPCVAGVQTSACTITLPVGPPTFERSNRYREGAAYVQDSWKVNRRLTLNLGVRWEYFGVQHNVNDNLDSNFYFDGTTSIYNPGIFASVANGKVMPAPQSPVGELWVPSKTNFSPRVGFAWDVFGDGKTSFRGGYSIGYQRNFGNVTYNVLFNPPNYAVVDLISGSNFGTIPATTANFGPLSGTSGTAALPASELRAVNPYIPQAYAHLFSTSLEHQFFQNHHLEVDYSGSVGVHLYDIANENRPGAGNVYLGIPCTPGSCTAPLNPQYGSINVRGGNAISNYNAMNVRYDIQDISHSGITLRMNYTWSHAIDELSDTFSASTNQFNLGYTDSFNPRLDYGDAEFDNRHRVVLSMVYAVPFFRHTSGIAKYLLDGWQFAPIFSARTGAPYSIYDLTNAENVYPRLMYPGALGLTSNVPRSLTGPNTYQVFNITGATTYANPITLNSDFGPYPSDMTGRDIFRLPGTWNLDAGLYKETKISERVNLQLRLEAYNVFNHANFGVNISSAYIYGGSGVITGGYGLLPGGTYGDNRNVQLGLKIIF